MVLGTRTQSVTLRNIVASLGFGRVAEGLQTKPLNRPAQSANAAIRSFSSVRFHFFLGSLFVFVWPEP